MDYQSLDDVVLGHVDSNKITPVLGSGVAGPFQVLQAMRCIPSKVVHIPWFKEVMEDHHVVPAPIWGNAVFVFNVDLPTCTWGVSL